MLTLPAACSAAILAFAPLFCKRTWEHAQRLLIGAILAPAQRTVTAALRVMGLAQEEHFQNYHRLLNRDRWSALKAGRILLEELLKAFVPSGVVRIVLDDTLERRRGAKIAAKGIYRDAVRSSHAHFVKASGLRWLSLMLITTLPWAGRCWALPVLTALAPSERYHRQQGRTHKRLTDWGRQLLLQLRRWLPESTIICVADTSFSCLEFLDSVRQHVTLITRLRLDAALFEPTPPVDAHRVGRPRRKGAALPKLKDLINDRNQHWQRITIRRWYQQNDRLVEVLSATAVWYNKGKAVVPIRWVLVRDPQRKFSEQAFLSTDLSLTPEQILEYYVDRWQVEVTFEESRQYLGLETQRQWSDAAIARTTPCLLALYSLVTLIASRLHRTDGISKRSAAWYVKEHSTFSDALAAVRRVFWHEMDFGMSGLHPDTNKIPSALFDHLISTLCYAS